MRGIDALFKGTEVTGQRRTAKLVIKGCAAQRAVEHDIQRSDNALRLAVRHFPRLFEAGNLQVRYRKADQTGFRLGAPPGSTLVTNFTTGAGCSTGKRGNGRRVVMGFHLHQNMHRLLASRVLATLWIWIKTPRHAPYYYSGVVFIGRQDTFTVQLVGVFDHAEQRLLLAFTIDIPTGVEYLVTAML